MLKIKKNIYKRFTPFAKKEETSLITNNIIYKQALKDALNLKLLSVSHLSINDTNSTQYINAHAFYKSNFLIKCRKKFRVLRKFKKRKLSPKLKKKLILKKRIVLKNKKKFAKLLSFSPKLKKPSIPLFIRLPKRRKPNKRILRFFKKFKKRIKNRKTKKKTIIKNISKRKFRNIVGKFKNEISTFNSQNSDYSKDLEKSLNGSKKTDKNILLNNKLLASNKFNNKLKFKIRPLNFLISRRVLLICYKYFRYYKGSIFPAGHRIFYDFLKMTALLTMKKLSLNAYLEILNSTFKYLDKRRHGKFLGLLKQILKIVVLSKKSRISGVKFVMNGKLRGKTRAKTSKLSKGRLHRSSADYQVEYGKTSINTKYGTFGLTGWVTYKRRKKNANNTKRRTKKQEKKTKRDTAKHSIKPRKSHHKIK